jgi:hypothetical protein
MLFRACSAIMEGFKPFCGSQAVYLLKYRFTVIFVSFFVVLSTVNLTYTNFSSCPPHLGRSFTEFSLENSVPSLVTQQPSFSCKMPPEIT